MTIKIEAKFGGEPSTKVRWRLGDSKWRDLYILLEQMEIDGAWVSFELPAGEADNARSAAKNWAKRKDGNILPCTFMGHRERINDEVSRVWLKKVSVNNAT